MPPKNLLNPRLWIAEGLLDKSNRVWDVDTSQTGLNLFKRWFAERKSFTPHACIWSFDRGKLVIPSVFMGYDQATKIVRRVKGELGKITTLSAITSLSKELIKKEYFYARAVEICRTLSRVFGEGEEYFIPMSFMCIVTLTFFECTSFYLRGWHISIEEWF